MGKKFESFKGFLVALANAAGNLIIKNIDMDMEMFLFVLFIYLQTPSRGGYEYTVIVLFAALVVGAGFALRFKSLIPAMGLLDRKVEHEQEKKED